MKSLFGLSMDTIMGWMLALFLIVTAVVAVLAIRNRLFLKLGLRNIPRRRAQTVLIIVGLMLSTIIITSAFSTGDTISYSIRTNAVTGLGPVDEVVYRVTGAGSRGAAGAPTYLPVAAANRIQAALAGDPNVKGVTVAVGQQTPLQDLTSGQTKASGDVAGLPVNYPASLGPLTTTDNSQVTLDQLGPNEIYINQQAADKLSAHAGDSFRLYLGGQSVDVRVRAVLRNQGLAAGGLVSGGGRIDPTVIMPLDRAQRLLGLQDEVSLLLISNTGDSSSSAGNSDEVTQRVRALLANPAPVAGAKALLASPAGQAQLQKLITDPAQSGTKTKLQDLKRQVLLPGQSDTLKSLLSDPAVIGALQSIKKAPALSRSLNDTLAGISDYNVQPVKKSALDIADLIGSVFTTVFVLFGLFSIAAGILLIFLIFVMLAAERRSEMGMARAIGTSRGHLIQQFLFEGYAYDLGAALVGMLLGIGIGLGMVQIIAYIFRQTGFDLQSHVEPRSLVVAFCLGALVTFITIAFSSWRVSRLNIVAAIRDLPEDFGTSNTLRDAWTQSVARVARNPLRYIVRFILSLLLLLGGLALVRSAPVLGVIFLAIAISWNLWPVVRALIARGPVVLLAGLLFYDLGVNTRGEAWLTIGVSLLLVGLAMLLRWIMAGAGVPDPVRNRIGYSLGGILLVIFWLLPFGSLDFILPDYNGGIEMFFVSGIMLVLGGVWTVMYNSDLLLGGLLAVFGGRGRLAPMLKIAVSYPMQHKFRTGMTLAMFSLVIFTLMVMSVLTRSTAGSLVLDRDMGGFPIFGSVNPANPIVNIQQAIAAHPELRGVRAGGIGVIGVGVRQPGQDNQSWQDGSGNIVDAGYCANQSWTLHNLAIGYATAGQVWQAVCTKPGYAVVSSTLVPSKNGGSFGPGGFTISGFHYEDTTFRPQQIEVRDNSSGTAVKLTVIGVLDNNAANFDVNSGIFTGEKTLTAAGLPPVLPNTYFFKVAPGEDVHTTALALGRTFLGNGLDVKESQKEFDNNQAIGIGLNDLLEGFMALGLVVGIAALGVIAFRSVVERRQQIGMMRAIGFKRSMIRDSFLLESSFVAILGTLLGVVLGLVLAKNLVDSIAKNNTGISLSIPWLQIVLIVVIAYVASLLTTYLPARQASRIYPAEALRYE